MSRLAKLLCGLIGATFILLGIYAVSAEVITLSTKRGIVTLFGEDARFMGYTAIGLGLLPCAVFLPRDWVVRGLIAWWGALMVWLGVNFFGGV